MSYPDSVRYLYALGNELKPGAKMGLERMIALLAGLKNPERGQRFVHVAGTNGKGSTCAMIESAMRAHEHPALNQAIEFGNRIRELVRSRQAG